jgi:hypothetical protein
MISKLNQWDKIEEKYMETPKSNFGGTDYHSPNATATTSAVSPSLVGSSEGHSTYSVQFTALS